CPFEDGQIMVRTGDLGRWHPDGTVEILGRIDQQVKLRGFRIETGEIEAVLSTHPSVNECVVVVREDDTGDKRLVGYLTLRAGMAEPEGTELRQLLGAQLPSYMVPSAFVVLDTLPKTPNGKLDRRALPAPEADHGAAGFVAPHSETERLLAEVWAGVLRVEQLSIHDNFFELGGHSLLATQVASRVRQLTGQEIPLRLLFEAPTIAEFAAQLAHQDATETPPVLPVERDGRTLPLSYAQQRLWFLDQLQPGQTTYHLPLLLHLHGPLDRTALAQSLSAIVARHEVLRTTFAPAATPDAPPVQVIAPPAPVALPCQIVTLAPDQNVDQLLHALVQTELAQPFDLQAGPLLHMRLVQWSPEDHALLLVLHHSIFDGWSESVFLRELAALYQNAVAGQSAALPELAIQYADYAVWQREWLQTTVLDQQLRYWQQQLQAVPALDLPTDYPRPAMRSGAGATVAVAVPAALTAELQRLSQQLDSTLFMTLLAAWQVLLYRYSGQAEFAVGTPIAGRVRPEVEPLIGFFVNMLVLRADLRSTPSFAEVVAQARRVALEAYAQQDVPFEMLVEAVQPTRDMSRTPLFQVLFALQNMPTTALDLPGLAVRSIPMDLPVAQFDLALALSETDDGLRGVVEYSTDLFAAATIERLMEYYTLLLAALVADPEQPIDQLSLLTREEQQQLLGDWNRSEAEYPREAALHQLIEAQAARTPHTPAIVFEGASLTYAALNARANQLAHYLRAQGVGPDVLVGLMVERSLEMIVGMLAILKAGGAYVPLDPTYPAERLQYMLAHSQAPVILTQAALVDTLPEHAAQVFRLDADWSTLAKQPTTNPPRTVLPDNLAYVIYTSGSTGRPKGVMVKQQGVLNLVHGLRAYFDDPAVHNVGLITSISFDISVNQIFPSLIFGRTLHIIPDVVKLESQAMLRYLDEHQLHLLDAVPSYMQAVLNDVAPEQPANALRYLLIGGEKLERRLLQSVFGQLGAQVAIVNIYGLTEISDINILGAIRAEDAARPITAGKPLQNNRIYIVDASGQPQPVGIAGEICVAGESV
ncbi:MAG: AMP-binding protein, partial [Chloroflexi bacterium]|nr:AMP-binding protein [Chloroflexota bacterium]